ncbi:hypothetical protein V2J09_014396 [Rumex salicifolius]
MTENAMRAVEAIPQQHSITIPKSIAPKQTPNSKSFGQKSLLRADCSLADGYSHISSNNSDPSSDEYYLVKSQEEEGRDQILPQFGEWKLDSSLADGYTHMTKPEVMQGGEDKLPVATNACQSEDRHCRLNNDNLKGCGCGCFPWGRK